MAGLLGIVRRGDDHMVMAGIKTIGVQRRRVPGLM